MQAMPSIVEADRRCHHASRDAQMGRLFPDDSSGLPQEQLRSSNRNDHRGFALSAHRTAR